MSGSDTQYYPINEKLDFAALNLPLQASCNSKAHVPDRQR